MTYLSILIKLLLIFTYCCSADNYQQEMRRAHFCINKCIVEYSGSLNQRQVQNLTFISDPKNMEQHLIDICFHYAELQKCLDLCPNHILKDTSRKGLKTAETICEQKGAVLLDYVPCLAKIEVLLRKVCSMEIEDTLSAAHIVQQNIINNRDDMMNHALSTLCQALSQVIKCISPVIKQSCNDTLPIDVMHNLMGRNLDNFDRLYTHSTGHGDNKLPESCTNLSIASNSTSVTYTSKYFLNRLQTAGNSPLLPEFWMWFFLALFTILIMCTVLKIFH